jgi:hypothetical protein
MMTPTRQNSPPSRVIWGNNLLWLNRRQVVLGRAAASPVNTSTEYRGEYCYAFWQLGAFHIPPFETSGGIMFQLRWAEQ